MKRSILVVSIAAALFGLSPIVGAGDQKRKAADDTSTVQLDVAMDASSARASRADWSITGPVRGDAVVSNGLVYLGGSIPDGDTSSTFPPTGDSPIGTIVSRGQFIADGAEIASGAPHSVASTQIFLFDEGDGLIIARHSRNQTMKAFPLS